jgi:hypothetical protein
MNNAPDTKKRFKSRSDDTLHKKRRSLARKAAITYTLILLTVTILPATIPTLRLAELPSPAPAPKSPHSAEQPEYDNTPAEPSEGLVHLVIRQNR